MMQYFILGLIVLWAVVYSAWTLLPAAARRAAAARIAGWGSRSGLAAEQAQALQDKLAQPGGCSACASCRGCARPPAAGTRVSSEASPGER